jgi:putative FmdB family regulatory protein
MTQYLYHCEECSKEFEEMHSIKDELQECPFCKEKGLEPKKPKRLISGTNFILSGGGWAKDRYS